MLNYRRMARLSWLEWLVAYQDELTGPGVALTGLGVLQLHWWSNDSVLIVAERLWWFVWVECECVCVEEKKPVNPDLLISIQCVSPVDKQPTKLSVWIKWQLPSTSVHAQQWRSFIEVANEKRSHFDYIQTNSDRKRLDLPANQLFNIRVSLQFWISDRVSVLLWNIHSTNQRTTLLLTVFIHKETSVNEKSVLRVKTAKWRF